MICSQVNDGLSLRQSSVRNQSLVGSIRLRLSESSGFSILLSCDGLNECGFLGADSCARCTRIGSNGWNLTEQALSGV